MLDLSNYPRFQKDAKFMKKAAFLLLEWKAAYQDVNIPYELGSAHAWLVANGARYKDHSRFLLNWVKRAQNRVNELRLTGRSTMPTKKYVEEKPTDEVMDSGDWAKLKEELVRSKISRRVIA